MRDGWARVPLGDVATQWVSPVTLEADHQYRNLGVRWYAEGTFLREPKRGSEIKAERLFRVQPGQFVYNRLFASEGSFALVDAADAEAVASNEFPVFDLDAGRIVPEYLALHFQQRAVWEQVAAECTGTTKSRKRWKEAQFSAHRIGLPPITEQRRIVDLIGALDDTITAAEGRRTAATALQASVLQDSIMEAMGEEKPLDALFSYVIGGSWGSAPGAEEAAVTALGTSAFTDARTEVEPSLGTLRSLSRKRADARTLQAGDIVLERSGGSPTQPVGRVIRMAEDAASVVPSDFMRLLRPNSEIVDPSFAFWLMWSSYEAGRAAPYQKFTTGIRNLNIPNYLANETIRVPSREEQQRISALGDALLEDVRAASAVRQSLEDSRTELLSALLSGEHEIPAAYDELMGQASDAAA
ncbi:hypothetical protein V6N00_13685 [Tersicoccus sp. MR15.9]|uniref:restriction endonuclease subunit S n=1 Tax=Tersicoccus mangrovi TaxID=3121635 RepID=UPI002FE50A1E